MDPRVNRARSRVTREGSSNPQPLEQSVSRPGVLVNTAGPWTRARVTPGRRSTPRGLSNQDESPGTAARHRRPTGTGTILPGWLVDIAGPQTGAKVTRDSWLTPPDLAQGPERELPGTAGRICWPSDTVPRRPGQW